MCTCVLRVFKSRSVTSTIRASHFAESDEILEHDLPPVLTPFAPFLQVLTLHATMFVHIDTGYHLYGERNKLDNGFWPSDQYPLLQSLSCSHQSFTFDHFEGRFQSHRYSVHDCRSHRSQQWEDAVSCVPNAYMKIFRRRCQ